MPGEQEADDEPEQPQAVLHVRLLPGQRLSNLVPVHDRGAEILDVVEPGGLCDRPRLLRDDPELQPEGAGAGLDRFAGVRRRELGAAEDVDQVDRAVDLLFFFFLFRDRTQRTPST